LRVSFCEENGEQFQHELDVTSDQILKGQFLARVDPAQNGRIVIAGRKFEFLGFSNSSLKAQICWFMAPFYHPDLGMITPKECIKRIGIFDHIRQPGRYAAWVGQAFSDTIGSARVEADHEVRLEDIERRDSTGRLRNFSDGVGKVSWDLVERIWESSERIGESKPTVFQIRYAGAKGMVSEFDGETAVPRLTCVRIDCLGSYSQWQQALPQEVNGEVRRTCQAYRDMFLGVRTPVGSEPAIDQSSRRPSGSYIQISVLLDPQC
jgi:hypothetical protein